MNFNEFFPDNIDPNSVSVYKARVIKLDPQFSENGRLYIDLIEPDSSDLEVGDKQADSALASLSLRLLYKSWSDPPELKSKANFNGSMSFTSSGDFHLQNYCFDMVTQNWFTIVSTFLNSFGVMNIPPTLVSLDTTPFPSKAVNVNVSLAAKEVVEESIKSSLDDLELSSEEDLPSIPTLEEILREFSTSFRLRSIGEGSEIKDSIVEVIRSFIDPIRSSLDTIFLPYKTLLEIVAQVLELYNKAIKLGKVQELTFPITQFANITSLGTVEESPVLTDLTVKNLIESRVKLFSSKVEELSGLGGDVEQYLAGVLAKPILALVSQVNESIRDVVEPIKEKIEELILGSVQNPLSELVGLITASVQPAVSSLPTIAQLAVKLSIKKVLNTVLGKAIKLTLSSLVELVEDKLENIITSLVEEAVEIIEDSIKSIIRPILEPLQESLLSSIISYDLTSVKDRLETIIESEDIEALPLIPVENLIKPLKKFYEIDWSSPEELSSLIKTILSISGNSSISGKVELETILERIALDSEGKIIGRNPNPDNIKKTFTYKVFNSKEEFLPVFTSLHTPILECVTLDTYPYSSLEVKEWLTNSLEYITIPSNGNKDYICNTSSERKPVQIGTGIFYLEPRLVYESELQKSKDLTGEDLVPIIEDGNLKPLFLGKVKEVEGHKTNEQLYNDPITGEEGTFQDIANKYYSKLGLDKFYSWINLESAVKEVSLSSEKSDKIVEEVFQSAVTALGLDSDIDIDGLINSLFGKVTAPLNDISNKIESVSAKIQSFLEREDLSQVVESLETITAGLESKVNGIVETTMPIIESTAKAASSISLQSCSMSQSSTGRDFSFTSGDNYDLSTTVDERLQTPYCKEIKRESLLEPNTKVLVLSVGIGKKNLYVIDILD